jgi:ribosomal protein L20
MPRATNAPASRERRKRVLNKAKGYRGRRSKLFRYAKDATMKARYWAYRDRKTRKRNFRNLWIQRINAVCREHGTTSRGWQPPTSRLTEKLWPISRCRTQPRLSQFSIGRLTRCRRSTLPKRELRPNRMGADTALGSNSRVVQAIGRNSRYGKRTCNIQGKCSS